eukprot:2682280-Pyramimonas_sp.AAC.1
MCIRDSPLAVTDGISKLTWSLYAPVYCRSVQRADASARCIVHNREVAMLAWKTEVPPQRWPMGFPKLTWGLHVPVSCRSVQRADARARALYAAANHRPILGLPEAYLRPTSLGLP